MRGRQRVVTVRDIPTCKACGKERTLVLTAGCIVCTKEGGGCGSIFLIDEIASLYKRQNNRPKLTVVRKHKKE